MINVKVMKRTIILILLTLTCGSCYVKHTGTPAGYEIIEYPVENGIGTEYHPSEIILCDERTWVLSARNKDEFKTGLFVTYDSGKMLCRWYCHPSLPIRRYLMFHRCWILAK